MRIIPGAGAQEGDGGLIITVSRQELVAFSSFSFRFALHNF